MGGRFKSCVPCHPDELKPSTPDADLVRKKENEYRKQVQVNYDRRHKATKEADELSPGDRAWLLDLRVEGKVAGRAPCPRLYIISTPTGLVRRNRKMTRKLEPGHNIPVNPVSDSKTNPPMPRGDLKGRTLMCTQLSLQGKVLDKAQCHACPVQQVVPLQSEDLSGPKLPRKRLIEEF